jgi:hypothetical protein
MKPSCDQNLAAANVSLIIGQERDLIAYNLELYPIGI